MEASKKSNELRLFDDPTGRYERALRKALIEDGYLDADDNIESLQWGDQGFKVNGKSVNPNDAKRYNNLRKDLLEGNRPQSVE